MRKSKLTDFILTVSALAISAGVALLVVLKMIDFSVAIVFIALSVACVAMSLINFETSTVARNKNKKNTR